MQDSLFSVAAQLAEAPLNQFAWEEALKSLAVATGGWGGQLFGVAAGPRVLFDLAGGIPADVLSAWERRGGTDPSVNPRVGATIRCRIGEVITEPDFISETDRQRNEFYHGFLDRVDTPYVACAAVSVESDCRFFSAVLRSKAQGPATSHEKTVYQMLLPHLASAARLQLKLEGQAAALSLGALEHLSIAAILCDFAAASWARRLRRKRCSVREAF